MVAVLAYAVGNQTITQRLFAVRPDRIKSTFITATLATPAPSSVWACSASSRR